MHYKVTLRIKINRIRTWSESSAGEIEYAVLLQPDTALLGRSKHPDIWSQFIADVPESTGFLTARHCTRCSRMYSLLRWMQVLNGNHTVRPDTVFHLRLLC